MTKKRKFLPFLFILFTINSCQSLPPSNSELPSGKPEDLPSTLTICLGKEPESLYLYGGEDQAADLIFEAIYDGPIDIINGEPMPVILESLPSFDFGSAQMTPVAVSPGELVVNAEGEVTTLQAGEWVFPTGCLQNSCAVVYNGESPLEMDQTRAVFQLKPDLLWSDGQPLTAADSVFSFEIASDKVSPIDHFFTDRTASYFAADNQTIEWVGLPGLVTDAFENYFWQPLPKHALGKYNAEKLISNEEVIRNPIGWGAYILDNWIPGEHLELSRNPNYYHAAEGLPHFDRLVFRITNPNGDTNLANLKFDREPFNHLDYGIGEFEDEIAENGCDLTTTTADMRDQMTVFNYLLYYYQDPAINVFYSSETDTQFLLFNLRKIEGGLPQRSLQIRQAFSQCIDRGKLIQVLSNNLFRYPTLTDIGLPDLLDTPMEHLNYSPDLANAALEAAGWTDHDGSTATPRISSGIEGIPDGSELGMILLVEAGNENENAASMLKTMLAGCGIGLNTAIQPAEVLWSPEEESSLFQGNFDISLLSWKMPIQNPCLLFSSAQIPSGDSMGTNFSHFSSQQVDEICGEISLPMLVSKREALIKEIQGIVNEELPIVPLYSYSALLTAQKDFCADGLNSGYANELSGIEDFRISSECR